MPPASLSFDGLSATLSDAIAQMDDPRQPSNATSYSVRVAVMGAFSCFFMQSASFLEFQRQLNSRSGQDNAQSLFGLTQIPSVAQIRNILDQLAAAGLFPVFISLYRTLLAQGYLQRFERLGGNLLVALDGTEYYSSQQVSCPCCSKRTSKSGQVTYSHKALLPVIVAPTEPAVVSLPPIFITPQDGHTKQDCEQAAAKRWISSAPALFEQQAVTLLGDDLFSRQPMCEAALAESLNFIFVCLPESHPALYDWIGFNAANGNVKTVTQVQRHGRRDELWQVRYLNGVPLRSEAPALSVNWCELTVLRPADGKVLHLNSWVTNHPITDSQAFEIAAAGRSRWKTENENHNVLKTQGYPLEHNFGHGKQHLCAFLLTLNLLAFLFHTVLHLADERYQRIRQQRGTRQGFFQDILALTKYLWFESWTALIDFMLDEKKKSAKQMRNTS